MENCQLILNSNSLCVICLKEAEAKVSKSDLLPLHHLTSKINSNLGSVFKDVTVPWAPNAVMDRLEVLADVCGGCGDLCEELLYKFQDDVGRVNCIKLILDKMEESGLEDKYKNCGSPSALFYAGIVDRLRKEIILHLKPKLVENQSATETPSGLQGIPSLLNIPDIPITQICSYLSFKDIRNYSTVSKTLRRLVFPSLIKSSSITFQNQSQVIALIDFIKDITTKTKKGVNLFIKSDFFDVSNTSALLKLFHECGSQITHLKFSYGLANYGNKVVNVFRNNDSIPVLNGNELFPNLQKLDLFYHRLNRYDNDFDIDYLENQIQESLPFIKSIFGNSPILKELKVKVDTDEGDELMTPLLFKLIGKSGPHLDTLETKDVRITEDGLGYLQSLNLKRVVLGGFMDFEETNALTDFFESQRNTLEYLEVEGGEDFTFPRMELLETLKLNEHRGSGPIFNQTKLPNLKTIEVTDYNERYLETLLQQYAEPTRSVQELILLFAEVSEAHLRGLSSVFECLSKLEVPATSCLNHVWKDLSGLEELTLLPSRFGSETWLESKAWIDDIITGLETNREYPTIITDDDIRRYQEIYKKMETKKSLGLLTRLRLLRIRQKVHGQTLMLSDIPCRPVLMKMQSLKCIDFYGTHPSFVGASRKVLAEMGKKMDLYFGGKRDWIY